MYFNKIYAKNHKNKQFIEYFVVFLIVFAIFSTFQYISFADITDIKEDSKKIEPKKINDWTWQIGNVTINLKDKEVRIPGFVNMTSGMIEYLAVTRMGKDHESILVLDAEPMHIHTGLLLLNIRPGKEDDTNKEAGQPNVKQENPKDRPLTGDPVEIFVTWLENGKEKKIRGEDLIFDKNKKAPMENVRWRFTGSVIREGMFMAQVEKSIVSTYYDVWSLINNPLLARFDDSVYEVNIMCVPKEKTNITMIIKK